VTGPRLPVPESVAVLYIGGEGRSGSTLMAALLGNHDGFFPVGECRSMWQAMKTDELCGCGERFSSCEFWLEVGDRAFGGWDNVDVEKMFERDLQFARHRRVPSLLLSRFSHVENVELDEYRSRLALVYRAIQAASGCSVIVDSTKDAAYALLLSGAPGIDFRVVHLVRDSRGVAYSWTKKQVQRPEYALHPTLGGTFMGSRTTRRGALLWAGKNLLFSLLRLSRRHRLVRYESLVCEPERELGAVLRLAVEGRAAGEAETDVRESFEFLPFHTLGGNRVRFERGPIRLRADDEWRRNMQRSQRVLVGALTFPLLVAYGYIGIPKRFSAARRVSTTSPARS
jgi:hypothetical protein